MCRHKAIQQLCHRSRRQQRPRHLSLKLQRLPTKTDPAPCRLPICRLELRATTTITWSRRQQRSQHISLKLRVPKRRPTKCLPDRAPTHRPLWPPCPKETPAPSQARPHRPHRPQLSRRPGRSRQAAARPPTPWMAKTACAGRWWSPSLTAPCKRWPRSLQASTAAWALLTAAWARSPPRWALQQHGQTFGPSSCRAGHLPAQGTRGLKQVGPLLGL